MVQFINQYPCTAKVVKENLFNKHNHRIRIFYIMWVVLMFVAVFRFAMTKRLIWLLATILFIGLMALTTRYKNIHVLKEWKRYKRKYRMGFPYIVAELGDVIAYSESNQTRIYSWHDYETYVESEHLIIMIMKDNSRLVLKKNAFTSGSAKGCIKLLQKKKPKGTLSLAR